MMRQILVVTYIIVTMCGCSVYNKFQAPETKIDALCGENIHIQDSVSDIGSWQEIFPDIHLQQLLQKGIAANTDLQIAHLKMEQAEAVLLSAKLAYLPSFALAPEGGLSKQNGQQVSYTYHLPLKTQWEIDLFGKLRNSKEQARATVLQSGEYVKMVQTQLVASIANQYYTLIMLDKQLSITKSSVMNQKENLETIIALKEAGMQTEAAVNQATANYYSVMTSEKDLVKQIRMVENSIALLINEPPHSIDRSSMDETKAIDINYAAPIPLTALANRPDVKEAEYILRGSFYSVNIARAAFYPSITLGGSIGWTNNLGVITNPGSMLLTAIGSLTQPLFDRGINRANLKIAKAQYQQSLLTFEKTLLNAGSEVNDALILCQNSSDKMLLRQKQVEANQNALENSNELMKHTSTTYLEVLMAQSTLLQAELLYVSDWFEGVQGRINLYKALGGGS